MKAVDEIRLFENKINNYINSVFYRNATVAELHRERQRDRERVAERVTESCGVGQREKSVGQ